MDKILLAQILVIPFVIARYAASARRPKVALVRILLLGLGFEVFYVLSVAYLYFRVAR